jgi:hypothetical protein
MSYETEILFISPAYMKRTTYLSESVDDQMLVTSIVLAQDKYVIPVLGTDLYMRLRQDIAAATLTADYDGLLKNYVQKIVAWWGMVELLPALHVRHDGTNLVVRTAEQSATISPDDLHREIERSRQTAQLYTDRLIRHLRYNWDTKYPEYHTNTEDDIHPSQKAYGQSGLTFSSGKGYRANLRHVIYPPSYG